MKYGMFFTGLYLIFSMQGFAGNYLQLARTSIKKKQPKVALALLEKAKKESPEDLETLLLLATTHYLLRDYEASGHCFEEVLKKNAGHINSRYNCAMVYSKYGQFDKALAHYEDVYKIFQDESVKGHILKLCLRLRRWNKVADILSPNLWWYDTNIFGKTIFLDLDKPGNGYGDCIQFLRYGKMANQAGAKVVIKIPEPLKTLFRQCSYIDQIVTSIDPIPRHDISYTICIASLLMKSQDHISMKAPIKPYLNIEEKLIDFWKEKLSHDKNFKIGLCWKSTLVKDTFSKEIMESPRSISLDNLSPLSTKGISFYSLQKANEKFVTPFPIVQFTEEFDESHGRFMDTAALIMNMDLIISVDTSIVHLAGALGKPTWLLLSCESDYRWFTESGRSVLYPDVTLFRQTSYGDWKPVVVQLQQELNRLLKGSSS